MIRTGTDNFRAYSHGSRDSLAAVSNNTIRVHAVDVRGPIELRCEVVDLVLEQQRARARRVALTERPYAQPWHTYLTSIGGESREFIDLIETASQQLVAQSGRAEVVAKLCLAVMLASGCVVRPEFDTGALRAVQESEVVGARDDLAAFPESGTMPPDFGDAKLVVSVGSLPASDPTLANALITAVVQPCRIRVFRSALLPDSTESRWWSSGLL